MYEIGESLYCSPETDMPLYVPYADIKIKLKIKIKKEICNICYSEEWLKQF